jgi:type II secretory pathway component PulL
MGLLVKRIVKPNAHGLTVEVSEIEGKEEHLLAEFQACQEGLCTCPSEEYDKLESLKVDHSAGKIHLRLSAKSGQTFDKAEIEKCLDHAETTLYPEK